MVVQDLKLTPTNDGLNLTLVATILVEEFEKRLDIDSVADVVANSVFEMLGPKILEELIAEPTFKEKVADKVVDKFVQKIRLGVGDPSYKKMR